MGKRWYCPANCKLFTIDHYYTSCIFYDEMILYVLFLLLWQMWELLKYPIRNPEI